MPMAMAVANEAEDITLIQNAYIGNGTLIFGSAPVIASVSSTPRTLNNTNSALLSADGVTDADGIARVWAVIRPPDYNQGDSNSPVQNLPSIDLMPVGNDRYEALIIPSPLPAHIRLPSMPGTGLGTPRYRRSPQSQ